MYASRTCLGVLLALSVAGCATGGALSVPTPEEIPGLEAEYARHPGDIELGLQLGMAYLESGRGREAGTVLEPLLADAPDDPGLLVLSGLVAEDAGDWPGARQVYTTLLDGGPSRSLRERIEQRLEMVRRQELQESVRRAIEQESQIAQIAPDPTTVGVFPFVYEGADPTWEPLTVALPELLTTDLAVTRRLNVLERLQIQTLVTELQLADAGRVDPGTGARSGRLLGSGHVVQARFRIDSGERIGVDAAVVDVLTPGAEQVEPVTAEDALERLFDLEKQLAFDVYAELGIQLTPAEREAINERQTESIQALLAFGMGLEAADAGDYALAEQRFAEAEALDPSFSMATQQRVQVQRAVTVTTSQTSAQFAATVQQASMQQQAVDLITAPPTSAIDLGIAPDIGDQQRSVIAEVLGQDRIGQVILLELIFRGPGGGK